MRISLLVLLLIVSSGEAIQVSAQESSKDAASAATEQIESSPTKKDLPIPVDAAVDRVIERERDEIRLLKSLKPIVETYMQIQKDDKTLGLVPDSDFYFLGQASFAGKPRVKSLLNHVNSKTFWYMYHPVAFFLMSFVDPYVFDKAHYNFRYTGQAFLGELRCYVFDVSPRPKTKSYKFHGRIWVDASDFSIIRINGLFDQSHTLSLTAFKETESFHFDSWRTNVQPGLWLPSYIYIQEIGRNRWYQGPVLKAQTRLWGYHTQKEIREDEFTDVKIETHMPVADEQESHDRSPLEALRLWRREAENNTLDAFEADGLLAPPGPVDKILNQIVTNIVVPNKLDDQVDLRCRVLLTSSFEMFSVGNTIILSRGLIDVIPDENVMALLLSEEVADALVPKQYQDQFAFSDELRISPTQIMKKLSFQDDKEETADNLQKAMQLINNSPYAGKLGKADLFFAQLNSQAKELKQLISPRLGNQVMGVARTWSGTAAIHPDDKDQIVALPLGSRIKLDAWDDHVELLKAPHQTILSAREKMPFEIVPLYPYATKYQAESASNAVSGSSPQ